MKKTFLLAAFFMVYMCTFAQKNTSGFSIIERPQDKQMDILYNGKLLTAYCYYDSIMKPFLYPINTLDGITITRGYPIHPLPGESTDHPHHTGSWLNYESVNGLDFWNNSTAIPAAKKNMYGTIQHEKLIQKKAGKDNATLTVSANWLQPDGHILLRENTTYIFTVKNNNFFFDRITTLTANDKEVQFKDVKDGFFAIRMAKELELPAEKAATFEDAHGNKTTVANNNKSIANGMYYSSNGLKGDSVWSSRGKWVLLTGKKDGETVTVAIIDHPKNIGYPAYWHARGYGLFAVNPLGQKVFSNGKEELNFALQPNAATTFRYRVLVSSGNTITAKDMNAFADNFAKTN